MTGDRVHLPGGFLPSGARVRAVCLCGWVTTPRVDQARALAALLDGHGHDEPVCVLCGKDYNDRPAQRWRDGLQVLDDPSGGQFVVCRGMPRACQEGAAQRQVHLDRAAFEAFGAEPPRPRLRMVE